MNKQLLMMSLVLTMTTAAHAVPPDGQSKYPLPINSDSTYLAHTEKPAQGNQLSATQNMTQCLDTCRSLHNQNSAVSAADNTGKNTRDSTGQSITSTDQSNSSADLKITSDIRSALVDDESLSTNAHNVKVITTNGSITLRGPVRDTQERDRVLAIVKKYAGRYSINNYLEVTTR